MPRLVGDAVCFFDDDGDVEVQLQFDFGGEVGYITYAHWIDGRVGSSQHPLLPGLPLRFRLMRADFEQNRSVTLAVTDPGPYRAEGMVWEKMPWAWQATYTAGLAEEHPVLAGR